MYAIVLKLNIIIFIFHSLICHDGANTICLKIVVIVNDNKTK